MNTNNDFENITLTKREKKLLCKIRRKGHIDYTDDANMLFKTGLVVLDSEEVPDGYGGVLRTNAIITLSPYYERYKQFCINRFMRSVLTPAIISGIVSLIVSLVVALLSKLLGI